MNQPEINYFFDINKFEKNRDGSEWNFTLSNGTQVRQIGGSNDYVVETNPLNSGYVYVSVYNKKGEITITGLRFYGNDIKKWIYFNDKQQIIKEIDNDALYPLSIEDLANILKDRYKIDLFNKQQIFSMKRYIDTINMHKPLYIICVYSQNDLHNNMLMYYLIDGTTGKTLYESESYIREKINIYSEYIKTTEEYKKGIYKIEN
ncbi:hypothetical protein [Gilliamella apis]|uniref:Uncharacterized protein n=1 Tax=Gilliamella apis TaxID=1970738 RepID=A0A242NWR7_9GAMM|nr:hypothetical protein [Gilliamella apis]OTQ52717.1 hypothetical protein B6D06_01720 [Gilliamella apis]